MLSAQKESATNEKNRQSCGWKAAGAVEPKTKNPAPAATASGEAKFLFYRAAGQGYCSIWRPMNPAAVSVTLISVSPMKTPLSLLSRMTAPTASPSTSMGVMTWEE
jgi:hypothetical protein